MNTTVIEESTELAQLRAQQRVHPAARTADRTGLDAEACAGLVTRGLAFAADALVVNGIALLVGVAVGLCLSILPLPEELVIAIAAAGGAIWIAWSIAYFVFFWSSTGQTPGNRVMGIRVVGAHDGRTLKPRRALLRFAGLILAVLPLLAGVWMMLWDQRRRCLQDRIAGTLVVYEPEQQTGGAAPAAPTPANLEARS